MPYIRSMSVISHDDTNIKKELKTTEVNTENRLFKCGVKIIALKFGRNEISFI